MIVPRAISRMMPENDLVRRAAELAQRKFGPRADRYDREGSFPVEDFEDLFEAGLHAAAVPHDAGGLNLGPYRGDVFTLWMMTKEFARVDLSFARCWEGHVNSLVILDGLANQEQKARWFEGVVQRGERWVAWSGEPQTADPVQSHVPQPATEPRTHSPTHGTQVREVPEGFVINGTKVFATSAGHANWAILLVNARGPGGARHATASADHLLLLGCDLSDRAISFDSSWWDPIGMRATVSHLARFKDAFIPRENLIGEPGQYLSEGWQACFTPQYAASFLGAAEGAFDYTVRFLQIQHKGDDPFVQQHVGQCAVNIETAHLWLRHVSRLWESGEPEEAKAAGLRARYIIEQLAEDTVKRCIRAMGARSLNRPSPIERIYRDLSFYVRHDNADHILATIGKSTLGQPCDESFFNDRNPDEPQRS
jgi:alkylation response protein AidB-like acyl-CoA dehydrogenase